MDLRAVQGFNFGNRSLEASVDFNNMWNANTVWDARTLSGTINLRQNGDPNGAHQHRAAVPVAGAGVRAAEHPLQRRFPVLR